MNKNGRMLNIINPINSKKRWTKSGLPPLDEFVKKLACKKKLIAVTINCKVSVTFKYSKDENVFVGIENVQDVEN